mmetsp:Transcript_41476/g.132499  ORF Transcript_41476/g.132499 Transcript_41476/m.132499 type:complete len:215 (-) Transcript_41476:76-720(-)
MPPAGELLPRPEPALTERMRHPPTRRHVRPGHRLRLLLVEPQDPRPGEALLALASQLAKPPRVPQNDGGGRPPLLERLLLEGGAVRAARLHAPLVVEDAHARAGAHMLLESLGGEGVEADHQLVLVDVLPVLLAEYVPRIAHEGARIEAALPPDLQPHARDLRQRRGHAHLPHRLGHVGGALLDVLEAGHHPGVHRARRDRPYTLAGVLNVEAL